MKLLLCLLASVVLVCEPIISHRPYYTENGAGVALGRLGDQLIGYVKGKWIAHERDVPYYLSRFKNCELFSLAQNEQYLTKFIRRRRAPIEMLSDTMEFNGLYFVPWEHAEAHWSGSEDIAFWGGMLDDTAFRAHMREQLFPLIKLPRLLRQKQGLYVAIHVRRGSGTDNKTLCSKQRYNSIPKKAPRTYNDSASDISCPYKFPPLQYYIDCINNLKSKTSKEITLLVCTDAKDPLPVMKEIHEATGLDVLAPEHCSLQTEDHEKELYYPLRDMFLMAQCDCLIRSRSHFAQIAHLLGDFDMVYYPLACEWRGNTLYFPKIGIKHKN